MFEKYYWEDWSKEKIEKEMERLNKKIEKGESLVGDEAEFISHYLKRGMGKALIEGMKEARKAKEKAQKELEITA